jgi:hypothetical protein
MKNYIESLERAGFIKGGKLRENAVINAPFSKVLDLLDSIAHDTAEFDKGIRSSAHTHSASLGFGGGRDECWGFRCRAKALNELAHFAALYSDGVFIENFLADYSPTLGHAPKEDSPEFRGYILDDIHLMLTIRPLLESNYVMMFTPPTFVCPICYAEKVIGSDASRRLEKAAKSLSRDLFEQMPVQALLNSDGEIRLEYETPNGLFRHSSSGIDNSKKAASILASKPRLASKIDAGETITLSRDVKRELGLHKRLVGRTLKSLCYQMSVANMIGAAYITDRLADIRILSQISKDDEIEERNRIAARHFQSIVPFVEDVPISKLVQLRQREEESFMRFRAALDMAMKDMIVQEKAYTARDAQAIYSDVIAPEIARLDQKVREAKRDLVKVPLTTMIATTAVLVFGMYSGLVSSEFKEIAGILGLSKVIYDAVTKSGEFIDAEKAIRPEQFYFLWRAKHLSKTA